MSTSIAHYIKAGYPLIYVLTHEPQRVQLELYETSQAMSRKFYVWSAANGFMHKEGDNIEQDESHDPISALEFVIDSVPEKTIVMLNNYHLFLEERSPMIIDMLCKTVNKSKSKGKTLVVVGCGLHLPPEIEKEAVVIDYDLPDRKTTAKPLSLTHRSFSEQ